MTRILLALGLVTVFGNLIACSGGGSASPAPSAPTPPQATGWTRLASAPTGTRGAVAFVAQGSAYVVCGSGEMDATPNSKCWKYDAATNQWSNRKAFPGMATLDGTAFALGTKGYVLFGHNNRDTDFKVSTEVWEYDTVQDTWTAKRPFPGNGRSGVSIVLVGEKAYCFSGTGTDYTKALPELWEYDPKGDAWARKADAPGACFLSAGFEIGGKVYYYLGSREQKALVAYDPATNTWTRKRDFPGNTGGGALGYALNGKGYVVSGYVTPNPLVGSREVWEYEPVADTWTRKQDTEAEGRAMANGFLLGGELYLGLGASATRNLGDLWKWRP